MNTTANDLDDLHTRVRQALALCRDDDDLAARLLESGALAELLNLATMTSDETAEELGIHRDSVRKLARKSATFPQPVLTERRFSRQQVAAYAETRQKRQPHHAQET